MIHGLFGNETIMVSMLSSLLGRPSVLFHVSAKSTSKRNAIRKEEFEMMVYPKTWCKESRSSSSASKMETS